MATRIVSLVPATPASDLRTDINNALLAKDKILALIVTLTGLRADAQRAFSKTIATDVAALKDTPPGKTFADAEFTKFTTWKTADDDFAKRIEAFGVIAQLLDQYVKTFAMENRDDLIAALQAELDELNGLLNKEETDETELRKRIHDVCEQLEDLTGKGAAKRSRRPAARKSK